MGVLLLAVGTAVPALPGWAQAALLTGAIVNPLLFLPLAFGGSRLQGRAWYKGVVAASFTALSVSL